MWHVLRAELAYFRPWLLGGFGVAAGVASIITVVFYLVGDEGPPAFAAAALRGMFLAMAPLVVGFIVQAYRGEERRSLLILAGPVTPRQLAWASALLPVVLLGIGLLAAGLLVAVESTITGRFAFETLQIVGFVAGLMFMMQMMGLLAQEAVQAHRERRPRAAIAGWGGMALGALLLAALTLLAFLFQGPFTWLSLHLGNLVAALTAMAASVALYERRTDFTR